MTQCKEGAQREGLMLDSNEELYKWFTGQVMKNLHVVFTMNPSSEGLKDRAATSPALFNRCVLNWFGDWSDSALYQVYILTQSIWSNKVSKFSNNWTSTLLITVLSSIYVYALKIVFVTFSGPGWF